MEAEAGFAYVGETLATAVASSLCKYLEETGQTHPTDKNGERKDKMIFDRLDLQHQLFHVTLGGKLYLSPTTETPQAVLDIATGDASWVLDYANQHPSASVIANDTSHAQLKTAAPNIVLDVGDANENWTYSCQFDFIHCRQHHRRIEERKLFEQGLMFLKPGGWMEMQELCNPVTSDDGTLDEYSPLAKWGRLITEASAQLNRPVDNPTHYASWMRKAGFTNIETVVYKFPTNPWPNDEKGKLKGLWNLYNVIQRLDEFTTVLFTKVLGWSRGDVDAFLVDVRKQLQDKNTHAYWPVYIVYGQKPLPAVCGTEVV